MEEYTENDWREQEMFDNYYAVVANELEAMGEHKSPDIDTVKEEFYDQGVAPEDAAKVLFEEWNS